METVLSLNPSTNDPRDLRGLLRTAGRALTAPSRFYRFDYARFDTAGLLTFGIGNAWAAAALAFFVQTINTLLLSRLLDTWMQRLLSSEEGFAVWDLSPRGFLWESAFLLLGPFFFLAQAVLAAFWTWIFARILIEDNPAAPEPVSFGAALRIQATALVSNWYGLVPVFGGVLAFFTGLVLVVTGVRERFGVSTRRAVAVVLSPYLVLAALGVMLLVLVLFGLSQVSFPELFNWDGRSLLY